MLTDEWIWALHKKYAKTEADFRLIYSHCQIIEAIAMELIETNPVTDIDKELVHVGCLVHDIGVYDVIVDGAYVQGVRHGVIGEGILKAEGLPERVWRIASHHTGVGLTAQDVIDQQLPIPVADYSPTTKEERLIMYADKFHTKDIQQPFFHSVAECRASMKRYGQDKVDRFDELVEEFGQPAITELAARFGHPVQTVDLS